MKTACPLGAFRLYNMEQPDHYQGFLYFFSCAISPVCLFPFCFVLCYSKVHIYGYLAKPSAVFQPISGSAKSFPLDLFLNFHFNKICYGARFGKLHYFLLLLLFCHFSESLYLTYLTSISSVAILDWDNFQIHLLPYLLDT